MPPPMSNRVKGKGNQSLSFNSLTDFQHFKVFVSYSVEKEHSHRSILVHGAIEK